MRNQIEKGTPNMKPEKKYREKKAPRFDKEAP
jgi:hypothetical protein